MLTQLRLPWLRSPERARASAPRRASAAPHAIAIGAETFTVTIARHRLARRYVLRMTREGSLRLTVPRGASISGGLAFAKKQAGWIERERARRAGHVDDPQLVEQARAELPARCLALAAAHALLVARVSVRNQRSRWGACSSKGAITLNWRLVQMPASVSDYVILHELMHLKQPNHSIRFWREVEKVCPEWRDAERWLRKHGRELL